MASAPAIVPSLAGIEQGDHLLGLAGVTFDTAFGLPGAVNTPDARVSASLPG
jgi:hypothetical protein